MLIFTKNSCNHYWPLLGPHGAEKHEVSYMNGDKGHKLVFYVHSTVHHKTLYLEDQQDAVLSSLYLFYCQVTVHVSGVSRTHHQEYTNCSYNHWYRS